MSLPKFKFYQRKTTYDQAVTDGTIKDRDVCIIADTKEIFAHNVHIKGDISKSEVEALISALKGNEIELGEFEPATGTALDELTPIGDDLVTEALGKLFKAILDNEEVTSEALNKLRNSVGLDNLGDTTDMVIGETVIDAINQLFAKCQQQDKAINELNIRLNQLPKNVIIYGVEKERSSQNPDFTTFINEAYKSTLPLHNNNFRPCLVKANSEVNDKVAEVLVYLNPTDITKDIYGNDISETIFTGKYNDVDVDFMVYCNGIWMIRGGSDETYERYIIGNAFFKYGNDTARYYKGFYRSMDICNLVDNKLRCFQSTNPSHGTHGGATANVAGFARTQLNRYQYETYGNNKNAEGTNIFKSVLITDYEYVDAFMVIEFGSCNFMGIWGMTATPQPANNWDTYNGYRPVVKLLAPQLELAKLLAGYKRVDVLGVKVDEDNIIGLVTEIIANEVEEGEEQITTETVIDKGEYKTIYYNTDTDEQYIWDEDKFIVADELHTLPNSLTTNSLKPSALMSEEAILHTNHLTGKAVFKIVYDDIITQFPMMVYRGITNITKHIWNYVSGIEVFANEDNTFSMYIQRDADKVKIGGTNADLSAAQDYETVFENESYSYGYSLDLARNIANQDPINTIYGMRRGGGLTTGQCAYVWNQTYDEYEEKRRDVVLGGDLYSGEASPRLANSDGAPSDSDSNIGCGCHAKAE